MELRINRVRIKHSRPVIDLTIPGYNMLSLQTDERDDEVISCGATSENIKDEDWTALPASDCMPREPLVFENIAPDTPIEELFAEKSPPTLVNTVMGLYHYCPSTKLGEGNVFTRVNLFKGVFHVMVTHYALDLIEMLAEVLHLASRRHASICFPSLITGVQKY